MSTASSVAITERNQYVPRGRNELHTIFERHFADFCKHYYKKYAPKYGGYCAWAVAQGDTVGIDPDSWKIVDGKLYLNYNQEIQAKWEEDIPGNIEKADRNWPGVVE